MRALLLAVRLASAALAAGAEVPVSATPSQTLSSVVRWTPPAGWRLSEYANAGGADLVVSYGKGQDRIEIRLFGAPGSFYRSARDFMAGPAATTMGRAPKRAGSARVAGAAAALYRREFPLAEGDPHAVSPRPRLGRETFCVLPVLADGRFIVLSHARDGEVPGVSGDGEKAWKAFLAGVRRAGAKD